jgi:6-phosphogluconate dehydrogenase
MNIGFLGLGRMGFPLCALLKRDHNIVAFDPMSPARERAKMSGIAVASSLASLIGEIPTQPLSPRIIWLMIPAGQVTAAMDELLPLLAAGDILIDGGNSEFVEAKRSHQRCQQVAVEFVSLGCSGGLEGAKQGPPMTISCSPDTLQTIKPLLLSLGDRYSHFERVGFGHLAKGIHNAIEYGMMQSIAEGVALYFEYGFTQRETLDTFKTWAQGSIIESRLIACVVECLENYDYSSPRTIKKSETVGALEAICGVDVVTPCIDAAIGVRKDASSADEIALTTLALMRNNFGGHEVEGLAATSITSKTEYNRG